MILRERIAYAIAAALTLLAVIVLALHFGRWTAVPRPPAEPQGVALTQAQGEAILTELRGIRRLLEQNGPSRPAAAPGEANVRLSVGIAGYPALGSIKAPVTLVEFTDYQCPFCKRYHEETLPAVMKEFVDKGLVRLVVRDLPLPIHPNAVKAAQAAHCADEQGKFWPMQDALFRNGNDLAPERIPTYASTAQADPEPFRQCFASDRHLDKIQASSIEAGQLGITGTPTFVIGKSGGAKVNGRKLVGAQPFDAFRAAIRQELAAAK